MKAVSTVLLLVVLGLGILVSLFRAREDHSPDERPVPVPEGQSLDLADDGPEVFRRAFWRRPSSKDQIVHAERREWSDERGVARWQWFLEVRPSEELVDHLVEKNSFGLRKADRFAKVGSPPNWFPEGSNGFEIRSSPRGEMIILVDHVAGRLFATGSGGGFARGTGVPARPDIAQASAPRHLPRTSPPRHREP